MEHNGTVIPKTLLFKGDGIHLTDAGYELLVPYIQQISIDTCLSLYPDDRVGYAEDAATMPEALGCEPPPLWNKYSNHYKGTLTSCDHIVNSYYSYEHVQKYQPKLWTFCVAVCLPLFCLFNINCRE